MRLSRLALSALALSSSAALAQTPLARPRATAEPLAHATAGASQLPITRVALYKNGVGFFEHAGRVTGDQSVSIDFTSAQLNDVLQSLTAVDLNGGRISGAGYNSTTPLEQQLKTLPLGLNADPSDVDFYNAIRGARVQVTGPGVSIAGRILSIDLRTPSPLLSSPSGAEGSASPASDNDHRFITVVSDSGAVKTLELTAAVTVTLLDTTLHTDVTRFLELLAGSRNQGLRHLTLLDRGTGSRDLRVSYISEVPVWKSTYRILFTDVTYKTYSGALPPATGKLDAQTATIQGWSVVDNTTGTDWTNVHLDLIAGAPQSFIQPLSVPYYARRPEIPLPAEAQLTPQTHESGDLAEGKQDRVSGVVGMMGMAGGSAGGVLGGATAQGYGSSPNNFVGGQLPAAPKAKMPPRPSALPIAGRNIDALSDDTEYQTLAAASIVPSTSTSAFDDFFEYTLTDPITIRKNESALVPILQAKLPIERVTLWSAAQPVALRALWITNSSQLTLDRGSFSIVENGNFGGEGLLDPIHPGEKRLLSYAADQAVHVDNTQAPQKHHLRSVVIAKGVLTEHYRDVVTRDYTVRNAAPEPRTVILEHTRLNDHQLNAETNLNGTPAKPEETLPNAYRFRLVVSAGATVHLKVAESHAYPRNIQVGSINEQQIKLLLTDMGNQDNPALLQQLKPVLDAQSAVAEIEGRKRATDERLNGLRSEEERQRANIVALKDADKLSQKRFVDELGKIEDQILDLQKQQQTLDTQLAAARADLTAKVQQVQFAQTLEP